MSSVQSRVFRVFFIFLSMMIFSVAQARVSVIVSAAPPARSVIVEPPGYSNCYMVQPGFYDNVWHHEHRVCEYPSRAGRRMWISGFWQCVSFRQGGICTRWNWLGGHWASRHEMGYRIPPRRVHEEIIIREPLNVHRHENRSQHHHW